MRSIGLIIQETRTGLECQYVSEHLDEKEVEISATLTDERLLATQLANHSNVYTTQITKHFKVYSIIITNISDSFGRAGFRAIRLFVPKSNRINNIRYYLLSINDSYLKFKQNNSINRQNYDDILSSILMINEDSSNYVSVKNNEDAVAYLDHTDEALKSVFDNKSCQLFNKVYVFDKLRAVDINIAVRHEMVLFETMDSQIREIKISNPYLQLKELKIKDKNVDFNRNSKNFTILCFDKDDVTYNTEDDIKLRTINSLEQTIERKYVPPPKPPERPHTPLPKNLMPWIFVVVGLLIVSLGVGTWYLFFKDNGSVPNMPPPVDISTTKAVINDSANQKGNTSANQIIFLKDTTSKDSAIYKTLFPKLEKYRFTFEGKKWYYKNLEGKDSFIVFYPETINEIFKIDSVNLIKKSDFLDSLEKISGQIISKKSIPSQEPKTRNNGSTKEKTVKQVPAKKTDAKSEKQNISEKVGVN